MNAEAWAWACFGVVAAAFVLAFGVILGASL